MACFPDEQTEAESARLDYGSTLPAPAHTRTHGGWVICKVRVQYNEDEGKKTIPLPDLSMEREVTPSEIPHSSRSGRESQPPLYIRVIHSSQIPVLSSSIYHHDF